MKDNDRQEFLKVLTILGEVYNQETSKLKIKGYWEALKDLDIETISRNATKHLKSEKFFPRPVELRLTASDEDVALRAYNSLLIAIQRFGSYQSVQFEDKIIHSVVTLMGGWQKINEGEQNNWFQKEFVAFYKSMQHKKEHPDYLRGIFEIENSAKNYDEYIKSPARIDVDGNVTQKPERKLLQNEKPVPMPDNIKKLMGRILKKTTG